MKNHVQQLKYHFFKDKRIRLSYNFISLSLLCLLLYGCDSFVEVDLPTSQLTGNTIFDDKNTANAALANIYAQIRDNGLMTGKSNGISNLLGNYTDELTFYGADGNSAKDFYNNTVIPSNTTVTGWWNNSYKQIYATNAIIEGVSKTTKLAESDKNQLLGEALFIRALLHFYLVNLFDNIPYITTTSYQTNAVISRKPVHEVYADIIIDLQKAITLLPDNYITAGRVRPNNSTANALLARIYSYKNQWDTAEQTASLVIKNTNLYPLENNIDKVFLKESTSTIWQLMPSTAGKNTDEGTVFIFNSGPPTLVALNTDLVTAFTTDDLRKTHWIKAITSGTSTWYHASKYKQRIPTGTSLEYSIVLRLEEQYLIRAEARAHLNKLAEAKEDLNKIRNRAGLQNTTANTAEEVLEAILNERKLEFFTEQGHRFFDLKRTGNLDNILSGKKSGWNTTNRLFPIPDSELRVNPNLLPQNEGY
ncbi:RagB/SusD family nutrient uptake outer membrane protein [Flavobacterium plurextorum]|uniref:RagB/SusD family nutrient uptake outer membrane protein n=1 Tax=Flavobacterium TaxID=237 RepID=UPI00214D2327|nr:MULTISPECIES: RagB/SusD family nutrient uptake outer membrane protein [Flavobacterium]UUW11029.1 RagB/SusD family nutrient uptake outer membrane protein [Flavobacterium plurextorum]